MIRTHNGTWNRGVIGNIILVKLIVHRVQRVGVCQLVLGLICLFSSFYSWLGLGELPSSPLPLRWGSPLLR